MVGGLVAVATLAVTGCDPRPTEPAVPTRAARTRPLGHSDPPEAPGVPAGIEFGRVLRLTGVALDQDSAHAGDQLRLWLYWQSLAAAPEDWRSLTEVVNPVGRVVAREDDYVGERRRRLSKWVIGDRQIDEVRVRIPGSTPQGEYAVVVSILRQDNQTNVRVSNHQGSLPIVSEERVVAATIEVSA
ncbi:MAG: hypothetical protein U0821_03590 [Chloroflexota bacterium]